MNANDNKNITINKKCVDTRANSGGVRKDTREYSYYSRTLKKPFDSVEELRAAEDTYYAELRAKEDKAATKKADAQKVEEAFKALNAARKTYKEKLTTLTTEYSEALAELKKTFEFGKNDIHEKLAAAETAYQTALKEFTDKYDQYHLTLRDGDFETTIGSNRSVNKINQKSAGLMDLFDLFFNI